MLSLMHFWCLTFLCISDFGSTFSGALTDEHGRVQAIWGSFSTQVYIVKSLLWMCFIIALLWCINYWFQLKFGCNTSEDHQFVRGIPIYTISQVLDKIISGAKGPPLLINGVRRPMPLVRILEVELYPTLLSKARSFGLSDDWVQVRIANSLSFIFSSLRMWCECISLLI